MSTTSPLRARFREGADELSAGFSSRALVFAQSALVLALLFLPSVTAWAVFPLALAAAALARPWCAPRGRRVVAALALAAAALGEGASVSEGPTRRIGVTLTAADADGMPAVDKVAAGLPADGRLRSGDRVALVDGRALDPRSPIGDLVERVQNAGPELHLDVVRDAAPLGVDVPVPGAPAPGLHATVATFARQHVLLAHTVRAACGVVVVILLLWADGRGAASMGLSRSGLARDLRTAAILVPLSFGVQIAAAAVLAALTAPFGLFGEKEAHQRTAVLGELTAGTPLAVFAGAMVATSLFEEVTFRGFVLPRLTYGLRSAIAALVLTSALFGAGHFYEGALAVGQTMVLGVFFGVAFLVTRRLVPVVVTHAVFNTVMLALLRAVMGSGLVDHGR